MIADIARCLLVVALAIAPFGGASAEPPAATLEVSGTVTDEAQQPIAGASVDAFPATALAGPGHDSSVPVGAPLASALSGSDGQFRVMVPAANAVVLRVRAPGKAEIVVRPDTHATTVRLAPGLTLAGRVLDGAGQAIAGIDITAVPDADDVLALAGAPVGQAISDENGAFRIADLAPGLYEITAKGERWSSTPQPHVRVFPGSSDRPELRVEPGVTLAGRVVQGNEGVEGARVCVPIDYDPRCVVTSESGGFTLVGLPVRESYEISATYENRVASPPPLTSEHDRENIVLELAQPPAQSARVVARLVGPDGNPFRGHISIEAAYAPAETTTDSVEIDVSDGLCSAALPPGQASLFIEPKGYLTKSFKGIRLEADGETDLGTVHLERGVLVSGIVSTSAGRPIADADIEVTCWASGSETKTGADGRFVAGGMVRPPDADEADPAAAPCFVNAAAAGFVRTQVGCQPGDHVHITLEPFGAISGRAVTGSPRRPVPGLRVGLGSYPPSDFAAADGRFVLEDVPAGTHMLHVRSTGYRDGLLKSVTVQPGKRTDVGDVVLTPGAVLSGSVFDRSTGAFVAGATVTLDPGDGMTNAQETTTDVAGSFRWSGLVPGRHTLVIHVADSKRAEVDVDVPADGATTQVELDPMGSIEGTVLDQSGQPAAGWSVKLQPSLAAAITLVTDQRGHYRSEQVPPGRYAVSAFHGEPSSDRWPDRVVIVTPGERSTVDLPVGQTFSVDGMLRRNGGPIPGLLSMWRTAGSFNDSITTACDHEGRFTIELAAPGRYYVHMTQQSPGAEEHRLILTTDQAVMNLDLSAGISDGPLALDWPGGAVSGSIAGPGGRLPQSATISLARTADPDGPMPQHCSLTTNGRFLCKEIADDEYWVIGRATGFVTRRAGPVRVLNGKADTTVSLLLNQPTRWVKFHVFDENGAAVAGGPVDRFGRDIDFRDGEAELDPSDPVLLLMAPHFAPTIVRVPPEALLDEDKPVDVVVERGRPLEVTIAADGKPLEGALLRIEDARGHDLTRALEMLEGTDSHLVSDPSGRIKLKRVARGTYFLHATLGDRHAKATVTMGNEANSATLDLR